MKSVSFNASQAQKKTTQRTSFWQMLFSSKPQTRVVATPPAAASKKQKLPSLQRARSMLSSADPVIRELRYLSQSSLLQENRAPRVVRATMVILSLSTFAFIGWASVTEVNEVARSDGDVVPQGYVQVVQHLEGGIIGTIEVKEGQLVKKGDLLLTLRGSGSEEDKAEQGLKLRDLQLQRERLEAFVNGREPDFARFTDVPEHLKQEQRRVFDSMMESKDRERSILQSQIGQKQQRIRGLQDNLQTTQKTGQIAREALDVQETLLQKGLTSRSVYLVRKERWQTLEGEDHMIRNEISQGRRELEEYNTRLSALNAQHRHTALQELDTINAAIAQDEEAMKKVTQRVERLNVYAPVNGYVKGLRVNTIGGVVAPGEHLLEIVPVDETLMVEIRISPRDIGHVSKGQRVKVKVDSFEYVRYGTVEGELESISATTFLDEQKQSFYRGRVRLDQSYVGPNTPQNRILPGMTVDAEIITGSKTILAYLLKPIQVAAATALTER